MTFEPLCKQWKAERNASSSIIDICTVPSYQRIIGIGPDAIPCIMKQLVDEGTEPDHWFWALQALTGENPVPEDEAGNMLKMSARWLEWWKNRITPTVTVSQVSG